MTFNRTPKQIQDDMDQTTRDGLMSLAHTFFWMAMLVGLGFAMYSCTGPTLAPALSGMRHARNPAPEGASPTNTKEVSEWIAHLTNHIGGSCCGEGDKYDVEISEMPTCKEGLYDKDPGTATVIEPSPRPVVTQDHELIEKPKIKGNLTFQFGCSKVTHERFGNPLPHAIAFIGVDSFGAIQTVYCVVPLPPGS